MAAPLQFLDPPRLVLTRVREPRGLVVVCSVSPGKVGPPRCAFLRAWIRLQRPLHGTSPEVRVSRAIRLAGGRRPLRNARLFASLRSFDEAIVGPLQLQVKMDLLEGGMVRDRHATGISIEAIEKLEAQAGPAWVESRVGGDDLEVVAAEDVQGWCLVCGEGLRAEPVTCRRCHTPHHAECWEYAGGCVTFACVANPGR